MRDAVGFLTAIPVRAGPLRSRSVALFPAVGALIGLGWMLAAEAGNWLGGPLVAAALVLAVDLLLTGGLHLDGLADTADGLASRRPPERVREVMKDPGIGAVGAATLGTVLLLRFALLASLIGLLAEGLALPGSLASLTGVPAGYVPLTGLVALLAVPVVGRCTLVFLLRGLRPRADSLAAGPASAVRPWVVLTAGVLTAALVGLAAGPLAILVVAVAVGVSLLLVNGWWRRRLGTSGDTIGAGGILSELAMLAGLLCATTLFGFA